MADKTTNDIKARLRSAGIKPFKYAKDIGKALLFDSLPNTFGESLPAFTSVYQASTDAAASISAFARGGSSQIKGSVDKMFGGDTISEVRKISKNLISDLKTGKLYDKNRSRDDFFGGVNDSLLDNFGGVDMTYTDDGEYIESSDTGYLGAQQDIAIAESKAADARMRNVVTSIGASGEAQMRWNQGLTQASMQLSAKMHDESMNMQKNQLAVSSAIYETMNKRLSELQVMLQEANKSLVTDVSEIKNSLKTIEKAYKPKPMDRYQNSNSPYFGGSFDIKQYAKIVKDNFDNSPFGMVTAFLPFLSMGIGADYRKKDNPILYLTDILAKAMIPKGTKQRLARANSTLEGFFPSLLAKLADKGDKGSFLGQLFGYREKDFKTIDTARYLKEQTTWTGKDSKALTDVIPTQLAQIISILSGQPLRLFNYNSGKFENAYRAAGNAQSSINNVQMTGDVANLLMARVGALNFRTNDEKQAFMRYVQEFFNSAVTKGNNINPYSSSFGSTLSGLKGGKDSRFAQILTGLLQSMDKSEMIRFGSEIQQARASRTDNRNYINNDLVTSGMIMAFANVGMEGLDSKDQDTLLTAVLNRTTKTNRPLSVNDIKQVMNKTKSLQNKRKSSIVEVLNDVRNILRRGVISYSYLVSGGQAGQSVVPPGFDDALKDARAARRTMKKTQRSPSGRERNIGGVTETERRRLLMEVRVRGNRMSQQRLEEIAEKLGYANVQELKSQANQATHRVAGKVNVDVTGNIDPREIGRALRGTTIEDSLLSDFTETFGNERIGDMIGKGKSSMQRFRDRITGATDKLRSPFKLVDYALDFVDTALFKMLYGDVPDDLNHKEREEKSVQSIIMTSVGAYTEKFGNVLNDTLDKVEDKIFNEKDGLLAKFGKWIKGKLIGEKDEDGNYVGGRFSNQVNSARSKLREHGGDVFATIKDTILGEQTGPLRRKKNADGTYRMAKTREGGIIQPLRDKFDELKEFLFGPEDQMTESRKLAQDVAKELKTAAPNIGKGALAGAGVSLAGGLLTGLFLPGGPLTGAIIGAAGGLVKSSDKLREYLFGVEGEDGKKRGGLISDKVQQGFKKYGKNILGGVGIGATLGNLGLLPFGLSNMAGAVFGAMGGMVKGSDKLRTLFFGSDDDPNSGVIPKNARKKIMEMLPGWLIGKTAGNLAWNAITSLGLIPGLSLLPGGPILSAMGGLVGAFSKEHLENFFFGKKDEEGKRDDSGVFSKMFNGFKDKVISPLADKINAMGENIEDWFHEVVETNMADFFAPMKEIFKRSMNKAKKKAQDITDMLRGAITSVVQEKLGGPLDWLMDKIFGKKNEEGKRKGGILRAAVSAPFKALGAFGRFTMNQINKADNRFERKEQRRYNRQMRKDRKAGTAWQDEMGNWHLADEQGFYAAQDERRARRGMGAGFWEKAEEFRAAGAKAREEKEAKRKARRKEEMKKTPEAQAQAAGASEAIEETGIAKGVNTIGANTAYTNTLLAMLLQQMGVDTDDIPKNKSAQAASAANTGTQALVPINAPGALTTVSNTAKTAVRAGRKAKGLLSNIYSRYQTFRQYGILDIPGYGIITPKSKGNSNDPEIKKNRFLKDLYIKADRAMTNSADPRAAADDIIARLPEEYSEEGIEIVNRVYDLNFKGAIGQNLGGYDGKDTGLLDTLKNIFSKVSPLAMLLSGITVLINNVLSGEWLNGILKNFFNPLTTFVDNVKTTASNVVNNAKGLLTQGTHSTLQLPSGNTASAMLTSGTTSTQYMLPEGSTTQSSGSTSGTSSGYSAGTASTASSASGKTGSKFSISGLFSKAGNAVKTGVQNVIGSTKNLYYDLKNPVGKSNLTKAMYKGARIGQYLSPLAFGVAGATGMLLDEEEKSDNPLVNLGKTVTNIPEMTIDYATSNGGLGGQGIIARSLSNNPLNNSMFRGIGDLSFSDIKTAATRGADAVADGATKSSKRAGAVAVEGISNIVRNIGQSMKSGLEKILSNSVVKKFLGTRFGKMISKIASGVVNLITKKLPSVLGKMTAKETAKVATSMATVHPVTKIISLLGFLIYDAISGALSDARVYFKVDSKDVTLGMRVASAVAKASQGALIQLLPYLGVPGYIATVAAAAIPTEWLATGLYSIFASDEDKQELENKQDAYYEQYLSYMREHYPDLDESEYEDKYAFTKWRRENDKTFMESAADVVKGGFNAVKSGVGTVVKGIGSAASWVVSQFTGNNSSSSTTTSSNTSLSTISQAITKAVSIINGLKLVKESLGNDSSLIQSAAGTAVSNLQNTMTEDALSELASKISTDNLDSNVTANFMNGYNSAGSILNINGSSLTVPMRIAAGAGKALSDLTFGAIDAAEFAATLASQFTNTNETNKSKNNAKAAAANTTVVNTAKNASLSDRNTVSDSDTTSADSSKNKSFMQKAGEAVVNAAKSVGNWISDKWNSFTSWITGSGRGRYGRGEYFSQTDPKWNRYDPTMADSGCGPTVAAMMARHYGRGPKASYTTNPEEANELSKQLGMRDSDGGTNPKFFEAYGASKGLNMQEGPANKNAIASNLHAGGAVGLMGEGGAFGSNMHYMMADGIDKNNNVHIVDPYGGKTSTQPLNSIVRTTNTAIYGSGRFGTGITKTTGVTQTLSNESAENLTGKIDESKMKGKRKPKDSRRMDAWFAQRKQSMTTMPHTAGKGRWGRGEKIESKEQIEKFIQIAQNEIGYLEKASNSNLDDKTANAGYNNYTKYGKWIGYNGEGAYWCHMFVSWCAAQAGISSDVIPKTASCAAGRDFFKGKGQFHMRSGYTPKRGDIVYFTTSGYPNGSGHVGIVTGCDGTTVNTIEGNTSGGSSVVDNGGSVCAKSYPIDKSSIYGYGSPNYTGETVMVDGSSAGSTSSGEDSETQYSGIFGAFQQAFDQIQSKFDAIFAPFTGNSSDSSGDGSSSTSSGSLPSGDMLIGDYVKQFESGDAGPRSISSGAGDNGGVSFGTYQFPSYNKTPSGGLLQKFWETYYAKDYPNVTPGNNDAFKQAWLDAVNKDETTFHKREWMISKDGDYATALNLLKQKFNYDPDKDSRAAQEAIWSTALQGPAIVPGNYQRAFGNTDSTSMDDAEWVKKFYQAKKDMVSQNFRSSSASVQSGVRSRYEREEPIVAQLAGQAPLSYGQGRGRFGRGRSVNGASIYRTGGIQDAVNEATYGLGVARKSAEFDRKLDAIDTQTTAISNATKSGEFGKGANDIAIQLIAENMTKVVELLTDIRNQGLGRTEEASSTGKGRNKYSSQNTRAKDDPGTISMRQMALRS